MPRGAAIYRRLPHGLFHMKAVGERAVVFHSQGLQ